MSCYYAANTSDTVCEKFTVKFEWKINVYIDIYIDDAADMLVVEKGVDNDDDEVRVNVAERKQEKGEKKKKYIQISLCFL